jgi:hypothetical protein
MCEHCVEPCGRPFEYCEHICPNSCFQCKNPDNHRCKEFVDVTCEKCKKTRPVECRIINSEEPTIPPCDATDYTITTSACGHPQRVFCYGRQDTSCIQICAQTLPCGHARGEACGNHLAGACPPCEETCGRFGRVDGHKCRQKCHGDAPCGPCSALCGSYICRHVASCTKRCWEECTICLEACDAGYEHVGLCYKVCGKPCSLPVCTGKCPKLLGCGHPCLGLCGQPCVDITYCLDCGPLLNANDSDTVTHETPAVLLP